MFRKFLYFAVFLFLAGFYKGLQAQTGNAYTFEMDSRISYLEDQVRILNGKIEELSHALKMLQQAPGAPSSPNADRVKTPEAKNPGSPAQADAAATQASLPTGNVQEAYDQAISLLNQGNYSGAESALKTFIKTYSRHDLALNARYWLGETYLAQSLFADAAVTFAEAYQAFKQKSTLKNPPKTGHHRAPEALIKLVFALKGMKKNEDACATLAQLRQEFPNLPANLGKLAERAREGLKCK